MAHLNKTSVLSIVQRIGSFDADTIFSAVSSKQLASCVILTVLIVAFLCQLFRQFLDSHSAMK